MKFLFNKFLNRSDKKLKWFNTNYFFLFSILLLIAWIVLNQTQIYNTISESFFDNVNSFNASESFNFFEFLKLTFMQSAVVNLSIIILLPATIYFERKYGTVVTLLMFILFIPLSNIALFSISGPTGIARLSSTSFFTFAVFLIDFLFDIKRFKNHKLEIIYPIITIIIGCVFMNIGAEGGFFGRLLYDCHLIPFIAGILIGFVLKIFSIKIYSKDM